MYLFAIGINHRTAPVEVREKLAFGKQGLTAGAAELRQISQLHGFVVLSTCNRTEVYATTGQLQSGVAALKDYLRRRGGLNEAEAGHYFQVWSCNEAISHLFRVAAGLESMVLGETEILGQVRGAYEAACQLKSADKVLYTLFREAIEAGKLVRSSTRIDQHPVSVSYAAVDLARQTFGGLQGCTVLIIGAGEMGELTLKHLVSQGVSTVLVSNRSYDRAEQLAAAYGGEAVRFDRFASQLGRADIVISCTAATHFVITVDRVRQALGGRERPLFLIDIAVPRDIEPEVGRFRNVILYDIDDLEQVVGGYLAERQSAASEAEVIVERAVEEFLRWLGTLSAVPAIRALRERGERIKESELTRYLNRLGPVDRRTENIIRALANAIVNKLLAAPTVKLKEHANEDDGHLYSKVLEDLFELRDQLPEQEADSYQTSEDHNRRPAGKSSGGSR